MNKKLSQAVAFTISFALLAGCAETPKHNQTIRNTDSPAYIPPAPKKINFISGPAIKNIIQDNTLSEISQLRGMSGPYIFFSSNGYAFTYGYTLIAETGSQWFILGDRLCIRSFKYKSEECYTAEVDAGKFILHSRIGFRAQQYEVYRGNAAKIPGVPSESSSVSNGKNFSSALILLVGAAALMAASTRASSPISSSTNDEEYLRREREREQRKESVDPPTSRVKPIAPLYDDCHNPMGCMK